MDETGNIVPSIYSFENDPYNYVMKVLNNKWKIFIINGIYIDGATRYNRFTKQLPISDKMLTVMLKQLESDGIIQRSIYPEVPVRVEYSLSDVGLSLIPILHILYDWGWKRMKELGLEIDPLGEMWHGYRDMDSSVMKNPYKR